MRAVSSKKPEKWTDEIKYRENGHKDKIVESRAIHSVWDDGGSKREICGAVSCCTNLLVHMSS